MQNLSILRHIKRTYSGLNSIQICYYDMIKEKHMLKFFWRFFSMQNKNLHLIALSFYFQRREIIEKKEKKKTFFPEK